MAATQSSFKFGGTFSMGIADRMDMSLDDVIKARKEASKEANKAKKQKAIPVKGGNVRAPKSFKAPRRPPPTQAQKVNAVAKQSSMKRQFKVAKTRGIVNAPKPSPKALNAVKKAPRVKANRARPRSQLAVAPARRPLKVSSTVLKPTAKVEPKFSLPKGAKLRITVDLANKNSQNRPPQSTGKPAVRKDPPRQPNRPPFAERAVTSTGKRNNNRGGNVPSRNQQSARGRGSGGRGGAKAKRPPRRQ